MDLFLSIATDTFVHFGAGSITRDYGEALPAGGCFPTDTMEAQTLPPARRGELDSATTPRR
jgi:hypothetical protein